MFDDAARDDLAGPAGASPPAPANLAGLVAVAARRTPDTVALVDRTGPERRTLSWAQLGQRVDAVAAGLEARDLRAGQRVALLGAGRTAFVTGYLAALRAGLVAVPLNPQSSADELRTVLADAGARLLLTDDEAAATVATAAGVRHHRLSEDGLDALAASGLGSRRVDSPQDPETLAVLLYTAGTSGRPKGVMLSHRALLAHVAQLGRLGALADDAVVLAALPLFHVFGLNAVLGAWLGAAARLVLAEGSLDPAAVIREEGVTDLPASPTALRLLLASGALDQRPPALRTVLSGAAPLPPELAAEFTARTGLAVQQGYGLTEAAPGVTTTLQPPAPAADGADEVPEAGPDERPPLGGVGRPLPGVEVRVGDGSEPSEPGEVAVRGPNLFSGYWPDGTGGPDAEGWFATGDIGYLADGCLHLVDRARELVLVNGFSVYPAEVEGVIAELPEVAAVAVVGRPDRRSGEQVVAVVEGGPGVDAAVVEHCARRLARFKRPHAVVVLDALPRGATGKIRKGELRALVAALPGSAG